MKDELKEKTINEFVELKPKMFSLIVVGSEETKGVNENAKQKELIKMLLKHKNIKHNEYTDVLFNKNIIRHKMKRIQNKFRRIRTYDVSKIYLSCFDEKRYILDDSINSSAYFHKDVRSL